MQLAKDVGIPESDIIQWDIEETKKGSVDRCSLLRYGHILIYLLQEVPSGRSWRMQISL